MVEQRFAKDGLSGTILKGVGIAALYPEPLYRTPGDIDIWLETQREDIVAYVRKHKENPFVICNLRFMRSYPSEVIGSPVFKIWQRAWMLRYN